MIQMQLQKVINRHRVTIKILFLITLFFNSCKTIDLNKRETEAYKIINSLTEAFTAKIEKGAYLNPSIIEKDSYTLKKNIFNDSGFIYSEICKKKIDVVKKDFDTSLQENRKFDEWDFSKIENQKIITEIILSEEEKNKYENSTLRKGLKNKHEIYAYKYILWKNLENIPMIRLSYPIISNNNKYALVYMSKHSDGTFIWVLENNNNKDWNVICEKRLSHY